MIELKYCFVLTLFLFITPIKSQSQEDSGSQIGFRNLKLEPHTISTINDYLFASIDSGYYQMVSYLLLKGADPNSIIKDEYSAKYGYSALMIAANKGYYNIAELLVRKGANVNYQKFDGFTALFEAVTHLNDSITNLLIKNNAAVNVQVYSGLTPLQYSVGYNLLNYSQDEDYKIIVDAFVNHSKANRVSELLINAGANINITDSYFYTPLMVATLMNNLDLVRILCKAGANPNISNNEGVTPLMFASENGYYQIAKLLIEKGADVNYKPFDGNTALLAAVRANNDSIAELLIQNKAEVNIKNVDNLSPLHYTAGYGYPLMTELLLCYGSKHDVSDTNGNTPLMVSVYAGAYNVTSLLISAGANVNKPDLLGNTPLMVASQFNDTTLVRMLFNAGADIDKVNNKEINALSLALKNNSADAFKLLIDLGAKTDNSLKISYYQQAVEVGNNDISSFLKSKGLNTKLKPNIGAINFYTGFSTSSYDFMVDIGGGIYEPISKMMINIGYKYRPFSSRVTEYRDSEFYQLWEKRYAFYLLLQHLFVLKKDNYNGKMGFTPGLSNELTWSYYRGLDKGSGAKWLVVPSIGLFYQKELFTVIGKWEVANYNKQVKAFNRFSFQLFITLPNTRRFVKNKNIEWLD